MGERIKIAVGGYIRTKSENEEIIPANALIPFGMPEKLASEVSYDVNLIKGDSSIRTVYGHSCNLEEKAQKYAEGLGAPFFELEIFREQIIRGGLFNNSLKKTTIWTGGNVQLYVLR